MTTHLSSPLAAASCKALRLITFRLKVKADAYPWLNAAAIEVNQVWNYCNAAFRDSATTFQDDYGNQCYGKRLSGFDLCRRTSGTTAYMAHIGAETISKVCLEYGDKIKAAFPQRRLAWRVSHGARRSLGWVPFKAPNIRRKGAGIRFCGKQFRVFESERLNGITFRGGCFAQDSCGDWWLCIAVPAAAESSIPVFDAVGIDLGCKDAAVTSDGDRLESGHYRQLEGRISQAQRRGHKKQAKRLHRKAVNQRKDTIHKFSRMLVNKYQRIYIGDVSSAKLVKTRMAKSALDAGWGMLRNQLRYKGEYAGRTVESVNENYTTRACSSCGALTGPAGWTGLVVRQFVCDACGDAHDRDVNAARNIRTVGLRSQPPSAGTSRQVRHGLRKALAGMWKGART
jgi:putative transposase